MKYVVQGKEASQQSFKDAAAKAAATYVIGEGGRTTVKAVFSAPSGHDDWLARHNLREHVNKREARKNAIMSLKQRWETALIDAQRRMQEVRQKYVEGVIGGQASRIGTEFPLDSVESHSYLVGGASYTVLYENCPFAGRWLFLGTGAYPNLAAMGFNNIASAIVWFGLNVTLWDGPWFSGPWKTFVGTGRDDCLTADGFNDKASSAILFPP